MKRKRRKTEDQTVFSDLLGAQKRLTHYTAEELKHLELIKDRIKLPRDFSITKRKDVKP